MEQLPSTVINPNLERVIKSFQTTAMRSLQGPGPGGLPSLMSDMVANVEEYRKAFTKKLPKEKEFDTIHGPPPFPIQQMPVFTPVDVSRSEKSDTVLEGEYISCFGVGGEKRLCLPQILNTVLRDFSLQQINAICDELHIFCSRCNPEQLHLLKMTGVLPLSAPSCGLITKTDAERLCNALLHLSDEKPVDFATNDSFKVYHECFGKCKGVFSPEKYTSANANCIQCTGCLGLFSPQKFVCHAHKSLENRTCHWGFDSANWRSYLLLAKDQDTTRLQDVLEQMKARFDSSGNKYKRKQATGRDSVEAKRSKSEEGSPVASWEDTSGLRGMSAFQPWSPGVLSALKEGKLLPAPPAIMREGLTRILPAYLQTGPPVLLHPERVIPLTESSRYERHFAPNVSLAPHSNKVSKSEEEEEPSNSSQTSTVKADEQSLPVNSKDYKEWDLPTESDDSSLSHSDEEQAHSSSPAKSMVDAELDFIRKAMDGKVGSSAESKEAFLNEFSKLRMQNEEMLKSAVTAKKALKQEIALLKSFKKGATEKSRNLEKKLDQVRLESECRLQEAHGDKEKLLKEMKIHQSREDEETCKYIQINRELQIRLQHYEIMYDQVCRENSLMREELLRLGINITELASKHKYNGSYGCIKSPPKSPHSHSPQSGRSPNHNLAGFARSSLVFAQSAVYGMKRERDT